MLAFPPRFSLSPLLTASLEETAPVAHPPPQLVLQKKHLGGKRRVCLAARVPSTSRDLQGRDPAAATCTRIFGCQHRPRASERRSVAPDGHPKIRFQRRLSLLPSCQIDGLPLSRAPPGPPPHAGWALPLHGASAKMAVSLLAAAATQRAASLGTVFPIHSPSAHLLRRPSSLTSEPCPHCPLPPLLPLPLVNKQPTHPSSASRCAVQPQLQPVESVVVSRAISHRSAAPHLRRRR